MILLSSLINLDSMESGNITEAQYLEFEIADFKQFILKSPKFKRDRITTEVAIKIIDNHLNLIQQKFKHIKSYISNTQRKVFEKSLKEIEKHTDEETKYLSNKIFTPFFKIHPSYLDFIFLHEYICKYNIKLDNETINELKKKTIEHMFIEERSSIIHNPKYVLNEGRGRFLIGIFPYIFRFIKIRLNRENFLLENLDYSKKIYKTLNASKYTKFTKIKLPLPWTYRTLILYWAIAAIGFVLAIILLIPNLLLLSNNIFISIIFGVLYILLEGLYIYFMYLIIFKTYIKYSNKRAIKQWGKQIQQWDNTF